MQPGPQDQWGGTRPHTYIVLFALKALPSADAPGSALCFDLLDTHAGGPPKLAIEINGKTYEHNLPPGGGDASIQGDTAKAREHKFQIEFPTALLRRGDNEVKITTERGSWMLYDALWMETPPGAVLGEVQSRTIVESVRGVRAVRETDKGAFQPITVALRHYGAPSKARLKVEGTEPVEVSLDAPRLSLERMIPWSATNREVRVEVEVDSKPAAASTVTVKPARKLTVYVLPHSHTDIGYTEIQTEIEKRQVQNLIDGMAAAKRTAGYPEGSRFVWNVEVLWAADLYQQRLSAQQKQDLLDAVKSGQVAMDGMYLNELTALCRPEELVRLFKYATHMSQVTGVKIDSLMISDVPGYTWGTVTAMTQAGIRYFSTAPNYFDRIGTILKEWENKPFYWVGPDGKSKVLVWIPFWGYAMSHRYGKMSDRLVDDFCDGLDERKYPYDIAHVRWSGHGDNAVPDPEICEFIREWNEKYTYPRFVITSTSKAFRAFEERYGSQLPHATGDWTPYWEDGAGSSALETGMNRHSSDRLAQAETLQAMFSRTRYKPELFEHAWKSVLLYSEHTWGAHCSVNGPERKETLEQWEIKKSYADEADEQSRVLLQSALDQRPGKDIAGQVDVINSAPWERSELVLVPGALAGKSKGLTDLNGKTVPGQRLASGNFAVLASDVPAMGVKRYQLSEAASPFKGKPAQAVGNTLDNGIVKVVVDQKTGGITEMRVRGLPVNLVDTSAREGLNEYLYFTGEDVATARRCRVLGIRVREPGPLVAALEIRSEAPGCRQMVTVITLVAGQDYVEITNILDKEKLEAGSYMAKEGKESLNFGYPFNVPRGEMLLDVPLGYFSPTKEQLPSACKNWLTVGRWAQLANRDYGVTWVTLDAPLIQLGGLTANLLNSQYNPEVWRKRIEPTGRIYSWAMNNHWGTNYRAYQEGLTRFAYVVRAKRNTTPAESSRFATGFSQPLLAAPARGSTEPASPRLDLGPGSTMTVGLKPSDDRKAWIVRLYNGSGKTESVSLKWLDSAPKAVFLSDTTEKAQQPLTGKIKIPGRGLVTLRAEFEPAAPGKLTRAF
jgi:hypothetical protein